jgi:hypothetical protein
MLTDNQIIGIREVYERGFASRYVAAKFGCSHVAVCRVWNGKTLTSQERLDRDYWSKVEKAGQDDCWEWQATLDDYGYGTCNIMRMNKAHRVAVLLDGRDPTGKIVRHSCDNPKCVNPRHLLLGTHADNVADCVSRNRNAVGIRNGRSKLNPSKVRAIRKSKATNAALAQQYGVDPTAIKCARIRQTWKRVI